MGFWSGTKKMLGHLVDVRVDRWLGVESLKAAHNIYVNQAKGLFQSRGAKNAESFDRAVDRLEISPDELKQQATRYLLMSYFFVVIAVAIFIYGLVTLYFRNWMGVCMNIGIFLYILSLAFRYHFWYFQITQKKLGCTLLDWYQFMFGQKRNIS